MKNLVTILKAFFSNQAAIDCRKNKWYVTLLSAVLFIFLPWIPLLSKGYTASTSSIFSSTSANYDLDKGVKATIGSEYFKNGVTIKKENGQYVLAYDFEGQYTEETGGFEKEYNGTNASALFKATFQDKSGGTNHTTQSTAYTKNFTNLSYEYYFDCISVSISTVIDSATSSTSSSTTSSSVVYEDNGNTYFLENFYFPTMSKKDENYSLFLNNFVSSVVLNMDASNTANSFPHSYTLWAKDFILTAVYPLKSTKSSITVSASYTGDINSGFDGTDIVDGTKFYTYLTGKDADIQLAYSSFVDYLNKAGRPAYLRSVWVQIGITSAVVAGTMLIASLILLFFNKRKSSIYRDSNYYNCLAEAVHFTSAGTLLGMAFGFFASNYVIVIIIGATLFRIVFVSNRICPPPQGGQGASKPLYQARS